jgi:energy-coupling factor transporter ATP-binding protein EcfA2
VLDEDAAEHGAADGVDPRSVLSGWANKGDEWVRHIVRHVLSTGRPLSPEYIGAAYRLFRQEKLLDTREFPPESELATTAAPQEVDEPLALTRISEVKGVNALAPGAVIEPHAGLTILFGENGTGKTGYARILKALANSRTADVILGDISLDMAKPQSAKVEYRLGETPEEVHWQGEIGTPPFNRISIFDTPAVTFHVDEDLDYVYTPASLALFNHVNAGIRAVQGHVEQAAGDLQSRTAGLLARFSRDSSIYPLIETLGAATDLATLRERADDKPHADERLAHQQRAVAALEANTIGNQLTINQRLALVLNRGIAAMELVSNFEAKKYEELLATAARLNTDYEVFRSELFAAASLPAEPEETWTAFIASGEQYRQHLTATEDHDESHCLYCRQPLQVTAKELVSKYREYLENKIAADIEKSATELKQLTDVPATFATNDIVSFLNENEAIESPPTDIVLVRRAASLLDELRRSTSERATLRPTLQDDGTDCLGSLRNRHSTISATVATQRGQVANRTQALEQERSKLTELTAAIELAKSWPQVEAQVAAAKESDRLAILSKAFPTLQRQVTDLSKAASDRMINQSFDALFAEECQALRAPVLKVQFVGRQGKAQRRKVLRGKHKPSKVLSEGEQKVLAIADFLAEARLTGITATVVFDDPVSSLDHRRIDEVAVRVAKLAEITQVIIFTHDILFATKLLSLFEASKRCTYYQVTDDSGKGKITHASGPRWDTISHLKKRVEEAIADAQQSEGETRDALIRTGYDWLRSWLEVFTETDLLQSVTQRYQPNVRMTSLPNIKIGALPTAIETVTELFERACRYIDGHSQPLVSLGVSPTLEGLEEDWKSAQACRKTYLAATE